MFSGSGIDVPILRRGIISRPRLTPLHYPCRTGRGPSGRRSAVLGEQMRNVNSGEQNTLEPCLAVYSVLPDSWWHPSSMLGFCVVVVS